MVVEVIGVLTILYTNVCMADQDVHYQNRYGVRVASEEAGLINEVEVRCDVCQDSHDNSNHIYYRISHVR